ncbi:TetR/AcrR family transcriptional regulator [Nocardia callitridis]|uniref:TetR/AcrR family transcriptional regulator n=1 Tax=Nocardia callitridis TaxID=648753 RepID=UPI0031EF47C4
MTIEWTGNHGTGTATQGYTGLTMEAVAVKSGVNKTTLYRWWSSKDALLADALTNSDLLSFPVPGTGTLRSDLLEVAAAIHGLLTDTKTAPLATAVLAAAPDRPQLGAMSHTFFAAGSNANAPYSNERSNAANYPNPPIPQRSWTRRALRPLRQFTWTAHCRRIGPANGPDFVGIPGAADDAFPDAVMPTPNHLRRDGFHSFPDVPLTGGDPNAGGPE